MTVLEDLPLQLRIDISSSYNKLIEACYQKHMYVNNLQTKASSTPPELTCMSKDTQTDSISQPCSALQRQGDQTTQSTPKGMVSNNPILNPHYIFYRFMYISQKRLKGYALHN